MPSLISCLVFLKNHVQRNRFVFVIIFVELLLIYHSTTGPQAPITYFQCVLDSVSTCRDERGKFWGCLDIAVQSPWALVNFPNTTDIKQCQGEMRKEDWRGGWLGGLGSLDKTVKDTWTLGPLWRCWDAADTESDKLYCSSKATPLCLYSTLSPTMVPTMVNLTFARQKQYLPSTFPSSARWLKT